MNVDRSEIVKKAYIYIMWDEQTSNYRAMAPYNQGILGPWDRGSILFNVWYFDNLESCEDTTSNLCQSSIVESLPVSWWETYIGFCILSKMYNIVKMTKVLKLLLRMRVKEFFSEVVNLIM